MAKFKPSATLKYNRESYTPAKLAKGSLTEKQFFAEYSRIRKIVNRRLTAMSKTEFAQDAAFQKNYGRYPTTPELKKMSKATQRAMLSELTKTFLSRSATVTGARAIQEETIERLNENGYDFVDKTNIRDFTEFMEYSRASGLNKIVSSEMVAQVYEDEIVNAKRNKEEVYKQFKEFLQRKQTASKPRTVKQNAYDFRRYMNKGKKNK